MKLSELQKHTWWKIAIGLVTIVLITAWLAIIPRAGEGVEDDEYWGVQTPSTVPNALPPDLPVDKMCPRDEPCMRTKAKWVSPTRMNNRFDNGYLGNSRGRMLPLRIQRLLTQDYNQDHKLKDANTVLSGKGCDHWWCKPLTIGRCTVNIFLCAGDKIGWGNVVRVELRCGGAGFIGGAGGFLIDGPPGAVVGVGVGSGTCLYDQLGSTWGWW